MVARGTGSPPAWAVEPVTVVEHDPAWAGRALAYAREVRRLLAGHLSGEVVHIGSTSVPGLPAKPVVDLQAVATDPASAVAATDGAARAAGWMFVPRELDRHPWRWFLVRVDRAGRSRLAHLHLMPRFAVEHRDDREAYTAAKGDFVRRVGAP